VSFIEDILSNEDNSIIDVLCRCARIGKWYGIIFKMDLLTCEEHLKMSYKELFNKHMPAEIFSKFNVVYLKAQEINSTGKITKSVSTDDIEKKLRNRFISIINQTFDGSIYPDVESQQEHFNISLRNPLPVTNDYKYKPLFTHQFSQFTNQTLQTAISNNPEDQGRYCIALVQQFGSGKTKSVISLANNDTIVIPITFRFPLQYILNNAFEKLKKVDRNIDQNLDILHHRTMNILKILVLVNFVFADTFLTQVDSKVQEAIVKLKTGKHQLLARLFYHKGIRATIETAIDLLITDDNILSSHSINLSKYTAKYKNLVLFWDQIHTLDRCAVGQIYHLSLRNSINKYQVARLEQQYGVYENKKPTSAVYGIIEIMNMLDCTHITSSPKISFWHDLKPPDASSSLLHIHPVVHYNFVTYDDLKEVLQFYFEIKEDEIEEIDDLKRWIGRPMFLFDYLLPKIAGSTESDIVTRTINVLPEAEEQVLNVVQQNIEAKLENQKPLSNFGGYQTRHLLAICIIAVLFFGGNVSRVVKRVIDYYIKDSKENIEDEVSIIMASLGVVFVREENAQSNSGSTKKTNVINEPMILDYLAQLPFSSAKAFKDLQTSIIKVITDSFHTAGDFQEIAIGYSLLEAANNSSFQDYLNQCKSDGKLVCPALDTDIISQCTLPFRKIVPSGWYFQDTFNINGISSLGVALSGLNFYYHFPDLFWMESDFPVALQSKNYDNALTFSEGMKALESMDPMYFFCTGTVTNNRKDWMEFYSDHPKLFDRYIRIIVTRKGFHSDFIGAVREYNSKFGQHQPIILINSSGAFGHFASYLPVEIPAEKPSTKEHSLQDFCVKFDPIQAEKIIDGELAQEDKFFVLDEGEYDELGSDCKKRIRNTASKEAMKAASPAKKKKH
jgi:hypothetical protein